VRSFAEIMTRRRGEQELEDWLTRAESADLPEPRSFANGIRRDQQAVTAGLTLPYSSAAVEGNVNKIKMLKRQMYGRASFPIRERLRAKLRPLVCDLGTRGFGWRAGQDSNPRPAAWKAATRPSWTSADAGHRHGVCLMSDREYPRLTARSGT
jgi:hypothetical protein